MRKTLSVKYLKSIYACSSAIKKFESQPERDTKKILYLMIEQEKLDWTNWLICRLFPTRKMKVQYAVFAARQVLDIWEAKYPNDKRPRLAIKAAEVCLKSPTTKNKSACRAACSAADSAADSAYSAAYKKMQLKIIRYGMKLLGIKYKKRKLDELEVAGAVEI